MGYWLIRGFMRVSRQQFQHHSVQCQCHVKTSRNPGLL